MHDFSYFIPRDFGDAISTAGGMKQNETIKAELLNTYILQHSQKKIIFIQAFNVRLQVFKAGP